jgi:hypothetical protein
MEPKNPLKGLIRKILVTSCAIAVMAAGTALALKNPKFAMSVCLGWMVSAVSFAVLCITAYNAFIKNHAVSVVAASLGIAKLVVVGFLLWVLITKGLVDPTAFMAGFSATVIALIFEGVRMKAHGASS